jgi:hypothetical protein
MSTTLENTTAYAETVEAWRDEQETLLRAENGWLTVVGLFWLHEGVNTVGSSPESDVVLPARLSPHLGTITLHNGEIQWRVSVGKHSVLIDGNHYDEATLHDNSSRPTLLEIDRVTFFLIRRGERIGVRVRDAESEARRTFTGRHWFAVDPRYRVVGHFNPYPSKRTVEVETVIGTSARFSSPGTVTFELGGTPLTLDAFEGEGVGELWFVFRDATSGRSTYGASRFLNAPFQDDGTVDLDFNKAKSPPCAFTPYATCPLPPRGNILSVPITAGETYTP